MSHPLQPPREHLQPHILPLSADAVAQVQSSKQITSLQGVVLALLENSLDAGASNVQIDVSFPRGSCTVEDNGVGIALPEFLEHGGLGKLYHTSKASTSSGIDLHGSTGTYLASLAALSLLSITSRHAANDGCATLTMHQGRVIARHVPSLPANELTTYVHGTRVTINDLFGNMPVRVKQRAMTTESSHGFSDKAWQELKYGIAALLLFWRTPCSVRLRDMDSNGRNVTLAASHPSVSAALTEKSLNQLSGKPARFDLRDALPLVFQAGFAAFDTRSRWVPVSASTLKLSVRGLICLDPAPTKSCQFVGLGIHPCSTAQGHSAIYESVNRLFADSSFGSTEEDVQPDDVEKDRRKNDRRFKSDGYTQRQTRGSKRVDRWPMYVLQIKAKDANARPAAGGHASDHQLKSITDVLEAMITQWLMAHNFRPRKLRRKGNEAQHSPAVSASSPSRVASPHARSSMNTPRSGLRQVSSKHPEDSPRKRQRLISSTGVDGYNAHDDAIASARRFRSADLDTWSRIKSGRRVLLADKLEGQKVTSTSIPSPPYAVDQANEPAAQSRHGHVESGPTLTENGRHAANEPSISTIGHNEEQQDTRISSDYFGSIDEADLLAAAGGGDDDEVRANDCSDDHTHSDQNVSHENTFDWTDPITKQVFKVNTRTGVVLPASAGRPQTATTTTPNRRSAAINTATTPAGRPLTLSRRSASTPIQRLDHVLPPSIKNWQNPVFSHKTEAEIPIASVSGPGLLLDDVAGKRCSHHELTDYFDASANSGQGKISKEALRKATVIRQVDAKFILCSMPSLEGRRLALVDQHAASERVLLEQLFAELCTPLDPTSSGAASRTNLGCVSSVLTSPSAEPLHLEVTKEEHELFCLHAAHFARWGVLYDAISSTDTVTASQVRPARERFKLVVCSLPPGIAERCHLFPKLLVELLRSEVWSMASSGRPVDHHVPAHDGWLHRIGSCPKPIIDMLNSRACRSAVMFNDVLSVDQCQRLLRELSECIFPFMCAHGRVSMVPLVELGGEGDGLGVGLDMLKKDPTHQELSFTGAFARWKEGRQGADSRGNQDS